jgi:hypothetical protein
MTFAELFPAIAGLTIAAFAWFWARRLRDKTDRKIAAMREHRPAE